MELTKLQKKIIEAQEDKIAVCACAASAKTTTLIEKIRTTLRDDVDARDIVAITFTRLAAQELIERLGDDYKEGMFVGTIHAYAASILSKTGHGNVIKGLAERDDFDELFRYVKMYNARPFVGYLFLDEAQDTGELELDFIFNFINPLHYFVVYDDRQTIYSFRKGNPSRPDILKRYLQDATYYQLNENFRNGAEILDYARRVISVTGELDNSICRTGMKGTKVEMEYDIDEFIGAMDRNPPYSEWAILCRDNAMVDRITKDLTSRGIPVSSFKQSDLTKSELDNIMALNTVKVLTIHASKGLAWEHVIVYGMLWKDNDEIRLNYVAITRAKKLLIVAKSPKRKRKTTTVRKRFAS